MTHIQTAAQRVGARATRAEHLPGEVPCPTARLDFAPIDRWTLLDLATDLRKDLKLTTNDIAVLRALLSFLPVGNTTGKDRPVTSDTLTIVFASNDAIARRAGGMDERVLRHAFRRLATAGLLERRDSASGKRFPIRRGGRIVTAYGLDLAPGFFRAPAMSRRVQEQLETQETVRALRADLFARRRRLLENARSLCQTTSEWLTSLSKVLRRKLSPIDLESLSERLDRIEKHQDLAQPIPDASTEKTACKTPESTASDGQIYRDNESDNIDTDNPVMMLKRTWASWTALHDLFPGQPQSTSELRDRLCRLSKMLGIRPEDLGKAIGALGWVGAGDVLNRITAHADEIRSPAAYLASTVKTRLADTRIPRAKRAGIQRSSNPISIW